MDCENMSKSYKSICDSIDLNIINVDIHSLSVPELLQVRENAVAMISSAMQCIRRRRDYLDACENMEYDETDSSEYGGQHVVSAGFDLSTSDLNLKLDKLYEFVSVIDELLDAVEISDSIGAGFVGGDDIVVGGFDNQLKEFLLDNYSEVIEDRLIDYDDNHPNLFLLVRTIADSYAVGSGVGVDTASNAELDMLFNAIASDGYDELLDVVLDSLESVNDYATDMEVFKHSDDDPLTTYELQVNGDPRPQTYQHNVNVSLRNLRVIHDLDRESGNFYSVDADGTILEQLPEGTPLQFLATGRIIFK
jgi:hypothetical protein